MMRQLSLAAVDCSLKEIQKMTELSGYRGFENKTAHYSALFVAGGYFLSCVQK